MELYTFVHKTRHLQFTKIILIYKFQFIYEFDIFYNVYFQS